MKKISWALTILALTSVPNISYAQSAKDLNKERMEITKVSRKELNERASKDARKEAKSLVKDGWMVTPGALPLEKQLDRSYVMQFQYDSDGFPLYVMAGASSIGSNYDAAKMQALELAKLNLAGLIQTEVASLIENTVANEQMSKEEATSITKSVMTSKNLITQNIGRVQTVVETYRVVNGKNKEVSVRIAYNQDMAKAAVKRALKNDLEQRGDSLHEKLGKLLGW